MDNETQPQKSLITGQKIAPEKQERARQMRRAMTPAEAALWERLRAGRLGRHFRRQQIIAGFIADFYCHRAGLVVEVDGEVHAGQRHYDAEREDVFRRRGLTILRVTNEAVTADADTVADRIRQAVNAPTLGAPTPVGKPPTPP